MSEPTGGLHAALGSALEGVPRAHLTDSVRGLSHDFRSADTADAAAMGPPELRSGLDAAAYAAYRMPATYAAVRAALTRGRDRVPGLDPETHLDVGGGTGAAAWAAAETFPTLSGVTVLDKAPAALDMGRRLAGDSRHAPVRDATWRKATLPPAGRLPGADLATASYVLDELSDAQQRALVRSMAGTARLVAVVEPGTPAGYRRILAARSELIDAGFSVAAPCPHDGECPLAGGGDWCHFAVRVQRSALQRQLKGAELGFEDEKFSYVVASAPPPRPATGRILRHPQQRKGLVEFEVCAAEGAVLRTVVSKRQGQLYKHARKARWGDAWPPAE